MTKEAGTKVLTAAVMAIALVGVVAKNKGWTWADANLTVIARSLQPKVITPEDAIYGMLDAAKAGDVNAYVACYTGHMQDLLKQSITEATPEGFRKYLQTSNVAIQGVALTPPENVTDSQVKVRVEYVYKDRNEVQLVYLKKESSTWKIYQVDGAEHKKTLVPYGAAVSD